MAHALVYGKCRIWNESSSPCHVDALAACMTKQAYRALAHGGFDGMATRTCFEVLKQARLWSFSGMAARAHTLLCHMTS